MRSAKASLSHLERTAAEPRDNTLHRVRLTRVDRVNDTIRLFRLTPIPEPGRQPTTFLPGQWLDVYVPGVSKAGGFTITSPPSLLKSPTSYLELAIQKSPSNPPAAWLWRGKEIILDNELNVRVGGSFVWPPPDETKIAKVVFIAGGVGINPLISIVSHLEHLKRENGSLGFSVRFLYTTRDLEPKNDILFLQRLVSVFETLGNEGNFELFLTGGESRSEEGSNYTLLIDDKEVKVHRRRIEDTDLLDALGPVDERRKTVCYICGVPTMTDEFVEKAKEAEGMEDANVLSEKWW